MTQRTRMSGNAIAMPGNVVVICGTLARRVTKTVMRATRKVERVREKDRKVRTTTSTGALKLFALLEFFAFVDFFFCSILLAQASSTSTSGLGGRAIESVINEENTEPSSNLHSHTDPVLSLFCMGNGNG